MMTWKDANISEDMREGCAPSLLDLLFTNKEGMVSGLDYCPGLGRSDRVLLKCQIACYGMEPTPGCPKWNFHRADFGEMNRRLKQVDWSCLSRLDVDEGNTLFTEILTNLMRECIPYGQEHACKEKYIHVKSCTAPEETEVPALD